MRILSVLSEKSALRGLRTRGECVKFSHLRFFSCKPGQPALMVVFHKQKETGFLTLVKVSVSQKQVICPFGERCYNDV